jgi:hypothetical protein
VIPSRRSFSVLRQFPRSPRSKCRRAAYFVDILSLPWHDFLSGGYRDEMLHGSEVSSVLVPYTVLQDDVILRRPTGSSAFSTSVSIPASALTVTLPPFFCAIVASQTFHCIPRHAASFLPLKVRSTFVSTACRSIVAYNSPMATGTPLLKSICSCCCRRLNGPKHQVLF